MSGSRTFFAFAAILVMTSPVSAQSPPATLTLDEAIQLARRYSPSYRSQVNDEAVADWAVRSAYASLLPDVTVSSGLNWQAGGPLLFGGVISGEDLGLSRTPDYLSSTYTVRAGVQFSGATFFRMAQERANRQATRARIEAATYSLESDVTQQYLTALRARDVARLARRELETAEDALRLAQARFEAGAATRLDAAQAEVQVGRAQVSLVQALADEETGKLRLLQRIGLDFDGDVELTTELQVFEPDWTQDELVAMAMDRHPQLLAARAAESASRAAARSARMQYLPSVSLSGAISGFTRSTRDEAFLIRQAEGSAQSRIDNCEFMNTLSAGLSTPLPGYPDDCSRFAFTDADRARVIANNDVWPFNFTRQPASVGLTISLPLLNGFSREHQVQQAAAAAEDARHQRREEELNRRAAVIAAFLGLRAAHLTVGIEERNVAAAAEQLELARDRYRLGAGSILELNEAQTSRARADQAHLAAIYAFHENLAALEAAVGRPLAR